MKSSLNFSVLMTCAMLTAATSVGMLTSCKEKPKTIGEKVDDALNTRPNEKMKDAAEDLGDAAKDAANAVKDAAKDATK